jgi:hypothetical protein
MTNMMRGKLILKLHLLHFTIITFKSKLKDGLSTLTCNHYSDLFRGYPPADRLRSTDVWYCAALVTLGSALGKFTHC